MGGKGREEEGRKREGMINAVSCLYVYIDRYICGVCM